MPNSVALKREVADVNATISFIVRTRRTRWPASIPAIAERSCAAKSAVPSVFTIQASEGPPNAAVIGT